MPTYSPIQAKNADQCGRPFTIRVVVLGFMGMIACQWSGCLSVDHYSNCANVDCYGQPVHVEVLRGISGYWPKVEQFQEELAARGVSSTVSWCELYPEVANRLIARKRANPHTPIVVVGYSLGANHALRLARRLQEEGVWIDRLILLETTYEDTIPANVRVCFNAYKPRPLDEIPFMRGIPLNADSRSTAVTNYDFNVHNDGRYTGLNHLTLCQDSHVQALLADATAAAFYSQSTFATDWVAAEDLAVD